MHKILRLFLIVNLGLFLTFFISRGTPLPRWGNASIENIIYDWWLLSTVVIVIIFITRLVDKARGKNPTGLVLDVVLFGAWACAFAFLMVIAITGFAAF
jgi:hypothetical protein